MVRCSTKKMFILVLIILSLIPFSIAETDIDLDSMTEEELIALRSEIDTKLAAMHTVSGQVDVSAAGNVIYDNRGCRLTVSSIDQNECKILIENNSELNYAFAVNSLAINGIMTNCSPLLGHIDVSSGKKGYMTIVFGSSFLEYRPEGPYKNIQILIWAYDNAKSYKDFETNVITIPIDVNVTSNSFEMGADVINECGLSISPLEFTDDRITIAVVNNNAYYINFDLIDTSANGWSFDTGISVFNISVLPNCQSIFTVKFGTDFKNECSITTVNDFEFKLDIRESGDYHSEVTTQVITFTR